MGTIDNRQQARPRPKLIKSMLKGLRCLSLVNKHNGLSVAEVSTELKLPKSTAYRVLETLCAGGYVVRDLDNCYRATSLVRTLSSGFDEEEWVLEIAHPEVVALGEQFVWGVGLATPAGLYMDIRETTDRTSPLTLERWTAGTHLPMDRSSPGHLYLAYLPAHIRAEIIDAIRKEALAADSPLHRISIFESYLTEVRRRGYALTRASEREAAVSVPVLLEDRVVACIGMHYVRKAISDARIVDEFVPALKAAADRIGKQLASGNYHFSSNAASPAQALVHAAHGNNAH